jgi:hypothetical protein
MELSPLRWLGPSSGFRTPLWRADGKARFEGVPVFPAHSGIISKAGLKKQK